MRSETAARRVIEAERAARLAVDARTIAAGVANYTCFDLGSLTVRELGHFLHELRVALLTEHQAARTKPR